MNYSGRGTGNSQIDSNGKAAKWLRSFRAVGMRRVMRLSVGSGQQRSLAGRLVLATAGASAGAPRMAFGFAGASGGTDARSATGSSPVRLPGTQAVRTAICALLLVIASAALALSLPGTGHSQATGTANTLTGTAQQGWSSVPLAEQATISRSLGGDLPMFWAKQLSAGVATLHNPSQGLSVALDSGRTAVSGQHGVRLGLSAPSVGRVGASASVSGLAAVQVKKNRISFASSTISEWFANGPLGVEQGFTLANRPAGSGQVLISQQLSGNLSGHVSAGGQSVTFTSHAGTLRYANLVVTDARGHRVPAALSIVAGRLTITINDAHAVYPLRVDPVIMTPVPQNPDSNANTGTEPFAVAFSPNGKLLATPDYGGDSVSVFNVDESTGQIAPVTQFTPANADTGASPLAVAFSPNGELLATANSASNTVSLFTVDPSTGQLTPVAQSVPTNADTGSEPFWVTFSPNGDLLATANYSSSTVSLFTVDPSSGQLTPVTQSSAVNADTGSGPFWVTFSPNGNLLATANQGSSTVSLFTVDQTSGQLTPVTQSIPADADTGTSPSSVAFSPNGQLLATANYTSQTVSVFTVDQTSGQLTPVTQLPATNADTGGGPSDVAFSPNGELLAVESSISDTVSLFTINQSSGQLTPVTQSPASNADTGSDPVSLAFSPTGGLLATANLGSDSVSVFSLSGFATSVALALAPPSITANGTSTTVATATVTDGDGNPVSGDTVTITGSGSQQIGPVTAGANPGTYQATITSTTAAGTATITAADSSVNNVSTTQPLTQTAGPATSVTLALSPSSIAANGVSTSTATATVTDANGNPVSGDAVAITSTGGQTIGPVTAGSTPGTYTATITSTKTAGTATITAADTSVTGVSTTQTLTQAALPASQSTPPAVGPNPAPTSTLPASTFKVLSQRHLSNGTIVVTLRLSGPGKVQVVGTHGTAVAISSQTGLLIFSGLHHVAWGPVSITRTAAGLVKITLRPDKAAKLLERSARQVGSSLHVRITIVYTPNNGLAETKVIGVRLIKARKR